MALVAEIPPNVHRISILYREINLQFNHFLVVDDEPLLYHTGMRRMFPQVLEAVKRVIDPTTLLGSVLGHYRLVEQIGAGGMGVVYRAHDEALDRDVAIKLLPDSTFDDTTARSARLLREARTASRLNHPHICTIYEVGEAVPLAGNRPASEAHALFITMELIRGATLSTRLALGAMDDDHFHHLCHSPDTTTLISGGLKCPVLNAITWIVYS